MLPKRFLTPLLSLGGLALLASIAMAQGSQFKEVTPPNVPRDPGSFSIHEGPGQANPPASQFKNPDPLQGQVPASFDWFFAIGEAVGSIFKSPNPFYAGYQSGQQIGFDFSYRSAFKDAQPPAPLQGEGPSLGNVCGGGPGDAFWVGYPRPGNVEFPPPFQTLHHPFDCWCRCDETITCPRPESPFFHTSFGGNFPFPVSCRACFPAEIRKHDVAIGTSHGSHRGYPISFPSDPGYQECLRQSFESFAASGPGGAPQDPNVFGL